MHSKSLCYLDTMITPKIGMNISLALKSIQVTNPQVFYLFACWTTQEIQIPSPKHFIYIKYLTGFKQRIYSQNDVKNRNLSRNKKCRFCDFFGLQTAAHAHEVQVHRDQIDERDQYELESQQTHLRFTYQRFEMPAPVVVYTDFESAIDEINKHKSIMLSCLAVSRIPTIQTHLQVFHAPHEARVTFVLSWTIWFNYKRVRRNICSMRCHWKWHRRSIKIIGLHLCVRSITRNWRVTRWDIMHM